MTGDPGRVRWFSTVQQLLADLATAQVQVWGKYFMTPERVTLNPVDWEEIRLYPSCSLQTTRLFAMEVATDMDVKPGEFRLDVYRWCGGAAEIFIVNSIDVL